MTRFPSELLLAEKVVVDEPVFGEKGVLHVQASDYERLVLNTNGSMGADVFETVTLTREQAVELLNVLAGWLKNGERRTDGDAA